MVLDSTQGITQESRNTIEASKIKQKKEQHGGDRFGGSGTMGFNA